MSFDLYAWKSPRDIDVETAEAMLQGWQESGGDPHASPFEPSTDVGWFYRELMADVPEMETSSDAMPSGSKAPIWLATTDERPARVVAMRLSPGISGDALDSIFALAAKYDLVLYDADNRRIHHPLMEMGAYASATFWPAGAIQAAVAGGVGAVIAVVAWFLGIPVLSWILILIGGFLFVMALFTLIHEGRKALKSRRTGGDPPPHR